MILLLLALMQTPVETWNTLIQSRIQRNNALLDPTFWNTNKQSDLAMQEYLMTLGQNGNLSALPQIEAYFQHPVLQGTALLAYGEIDGAPTEPLHKIAAQIRPENQALYLEALAKLAGPNDHAHLFEHWQKQTAEVKNQALYTLWRQAHQALNEAILAELRSKPSEDHDGYVYYLYRSRQKLSALMLHKLLEVFQGNNQALMFALRISPSDQHELLTQKCAELTSDVDWRLRVNAFSLFRKAGNEEQIEKLGFKLLRDSNPNVVRTALTGLLALNKPQIDKALVTKTDLFSQSHLQTILAQVDKDRVKTFYHLVKHWEKEPKGSWKRMRWIQFLAKTNREDDFAKLVYIFKGRPWQIGTPAERAQALTSLSTRKYIGMGTLIKEAFEEDDPFLLGAALNALMNLEEKERPISSEELKSYVRRFYVDSFFHNAFFSHWKKIYSPAEQEEILEKLIKHPDYLVRQLALAQIEKPTLEQRQQVFRKPWPHQLPKAITDIAGSLVAGKDIHLWDVETSKGRILIQLYGNYAPITTANIMHLAESGHFNKMAVHRVVPNFVAQFGDNRGDGAGTPGYSIPCEVNSLRYGLGTVGMALSGKDTGGSQMFIGHSAQPHLDGGYTVFGSVIEGMDVVDRLEEGDLILQSKIHTQKQEKP